MFKKLKIIWENRKNIFQGIKNTWFSKASIEDIAFERMAICNQCPLLDTTGSKCMVSGTQPCCSVCGCKLAYKTRSLSSECPHPDGPKWKATMTEEEQDKYYAEINYNPDEP
jgi:hypothetical protein